MNTQSCVKCGASERYKCGACKACAKEKSKAYRNDNAEKVAAFQAAYRKSNKKKIAISKAKWTQENSERLRKKQKDYSKANSVAASLRAAKWKAENPELEKKTRMDYAEKNKGKKQKYLAEYHKLNAQKKCAASKKWRIDNPEKYKETKTKYAKEKPEVGLNARRNRRARKRNATGSLSKELAAKLFELQKGKCPCCTQPLGESYHLDHIVTLALGGSNTDDNIQLLRATCNLQKSAKHPIDFMQSRGFLL
jgi:hypothetical protein